MAKFGNFLGVFTIFYHQRILIYQGFPRFWALCFFDTCIYAQIAWKKIFMQFYVYSCIECIALFLYIMLQKSCQFFIYQFPIFTIFYIKLCIQYTPNFSILTHCKNRASRFCVFKQQIATKFLQKRLNRKIRAYFLLKIKNQNRWNSCGTRLASVFV